MFTDKLNSELQFNERYLSGVRFRVKCTLGWSWTFYIGVPFTKLLSDESNQTSQVVEEWLQGTETDKLNFPPNSVLLRSVSRLFFNSFFNFQFTDNLLADTVSSNLISTLRQFCHFLFCSLLVY